MTLLGPIFSISHYVILILPSLPPARAEATRGAQQVLHGEGRALSRPARCTKVYPKVFNLTHNQAYTIIYSNHDVEKKKPSQNPHSRPHHQSR